MIQEFKSQHWSDENGCPQGGISQATGIFVYWQNGALGRVEDKTRKEPNGAFVETVIKIALDRLKYYQSTKFNCEENAIVMIHLEHALQKLNDRTKDREQRKVEGTHQS